MSWTHSGAAVDVITRTSNACRCHGLGGRRRRGWARRQRGADAGDRRECATTRRVCWSARGRRDCGRDADAAMERRRDDVQRVEGAGCADPVRRGLRAGKERPGRWTSESATPHNGDAAGAVESARIDKSTDGHNEAFGGVGAAVSSQFARGGREGMAASAKPARLVTGNYRTRPNHSSPPAHAGPASPSAGAILHSLSSLPSSIGCIVDLLHMCELKVT